MILVGRWQVDEYYEARDNVGFSKCKGTSAMARHLKYTKAVRQLAAGASAMVSDPHHERVDFGRSVHVHL